MPPRTANCHGRSASYSREKPYETSRSSDVFHPERPPLDDFDRSGLEDPRVGYPFEERLDARGDDAGDASAGEVPLEEAYSPCRGLLVHPLLEGERRPARFEERGVVHEEGDVLEEFLGEVQSRRDEEHRAARRGIDGAGHDRDRALGEAPRAHGAAAEGLNQPPAVRVLEDEP